MTESSIFNTLARQTEVNGKRVRAMNALASAFSSVGKALIEMAETPMNDHISNVAAASALVARELMSMALNIEEAEREAFFDPRNLDLWMDSFIDRLRTKYQQPDRIASND